MTTKTSINTKTRIANFIFITLLVGINSTIAEQPLEQIKAEANTQCPLISALNNLFFEQPAKYFDKAQNALNKGDRKASAKYLREGTKSICKAALKAVDPQAKEKLEQIAMTLATISDSLENESLKDEKQTLANTLAWSYIALANHHRTLASKYYNKDEYIQSISGTDMNRISNALRTAANEINKAAMTAGITLKDGSRYSLNQVKRTAEAILSTGTPNPAAIQKSFQLLRYESKQLSKMLIPISEPTINNEASE